MTDSTDTSETANGARRARAQSHADESLESQVAQLRNDIRSISETLTRMGERKVGEVRDTAKARAQEFAERGEAMVESAQDEFSALEKQLKDTIREKPLTAVAGALALGFLVAVITR